jgi:hypothetical protein
MAARPQNIGIKAIELYFPSQVREFLYNFLPRQQARPLFCPSFRDRKGP